MHEVDSTPQALAESPGSRRRARGLIIGSIVGIALVVAVSSFAASRVSDSKAAKLDVGAESTTASPEGSTTNAPPEPESSTTELVTTTTMSLNGDLTPEQDQQLEVVQTLATALADHDWPSARANPAFANTTDQVFAKGYGGLYSSIAVFVRSAPAGGSDVNVRVGFVAWEDVGSGQRTNVYCATWTIDVGQSVAVHLGEFSRITQQPVSGEVAPISFADQIRTSC